AVMRDQRPCGWNTIALDGLQTRTAVACQKLSTVFGVTSSAKKRGIRIKETFNAKRAQKEQGDGYHRSPGNTPARLAFIAAEQVRVHQRPRLPADHGPALIAQALDDILQINDIDHIRGRAHHPQAQGKIER